MSLTAQRRDLLGKWSEKPWAFLTGIDPTTQVGPDGSQWPEGVPIVWTKDETDRKQPIKPFPVKLRYLRYLVDLLENEDKLFIQKSRQMIITTTVALHSAWDSSTKDARRIVLSKATERQAAEIIRDKIRFPWSKLPAWIQDAWPCAPRPAIRCDFRAGSSYILGCTENVAAGEGRGGSASRGIIDEAAFQDGFADIVSAFLPMAAQFVALTTPRLGAEGAATFQSYLE